MAKASKKLINKDISNMATKPKTKKTVKVLKNLRSSVGESVSEEIREVKRPPYGFLVKVLIIVALGSVIYLLAQKYRGQFLAGTINSSPITRWELNQKMAEKYGKQTLDEIINERLLASELKKNNVVITDQEVSAEMAKIVKEYGSEDAFKSALTQYGMTEDQAKKSIEQSLSLKKLMEKLYKIDITDAQVKKYFDDNKKSYDGKKLEDVTAEIKDTLYQQEIYTKTQEWFSQVRKSAKIVSFI